MRKWLLWVIALLGVGGCAIAITLYINRVQRDKAAAAAAEAFYSRAAKGRLKPRREYCGLRSSFGKPRTTS
jgi:hypothetical protein